METEVHKDSESGKSEIVQSYPKRPKLGDPFDAVNKKTGSYNHSNQATNVDSDKNNPYSFVINNLVRHQPPHLINLKRSAKSDGYNLFPWIKSGDTSIQTTSEDSKSGYNLFRSVKSGGYNLFPSIESGDTSIQTTVEDSKSGYNLCSAVNFGDTCFGSAVKVSKSDEKTVDFGPPPLWWYETFPPVSDKSGDKSIKTTPGDSKIDYMTCPIGEDPIMEPTKEDVESDEAIMALYKTWCRRNRKSRTPEEMKQRFHFFKENAVGVYKDNIECRSCRFGLFHWADDPTLMPRPGVTWYTSRDGICGPYPTLEPRSG